MITEDFIKKANKVHNNKYDYSEVCFIGYKIKVKIVCPIHGIWEQTPSNHLNAHGCWKCYRKTRIDTLDSFIKKANKVHNNKYDYSEATYKNSRSKISVVCPNHGHFIQQAGTHLEGHGCPKCAPQKSPLTSSEFVDRAKKVHGNLYNYSKVAYKQANKKVRIVCLIHGIFKQRPSQHLKGRGCPQCSLSKGELEIKNWLELNKISFEAQKRFKTCRDKIPLPFDFFLPKENCLIEFQGPQHYQAFSIFGGSKKLKITKIHDTIKVKWAKENNFKLIRIKFDENISKRLTKESIYG